MSVGYLHCPNCGDPWKRVRFERFIRIGSPRRQCRVCKTWFDTGETEWPCLKWGQRVGFLAQNLLRILPLAALFALTIPISQFFGLVPVRDLVGYSFDAGLYLLGLLGVLLAWSAVQVVWSIVRAWRSRGAAAPVAPSKFVSDSAWEAAQMVRPRFVKPQPVPISGAPSPTPIEPRREASSDKDALRKADAG
jgi:hypothetical protein